MYHGLMRLLAMSIAVQSLALGMNCKLGDKSCLADDSIEGRSMLHRASLARQPPLAPPLAPPPAANAPGFHAIKSPDEDVVEELPPGEAGKAEEEAMLEPEVADLNSAAEEPAWLSEAEEEEAKLEIDAATAAQFTGGESMQKTEMEENGSVLKPEGQAMMQADEEADFDSDDGDSSTEDEAKVIDELLTMSTGMEAEEKMAQADETADFHSDDGDMEDPVLKSDNEAMLQADEEADLDSDDGDALADAEAMADEAAQDKSGETTPTADMEDPVETALTADTEDPAETTLAPDMEDIFHKADTKHPVPKGENAAMPPADLVTDEGGAPAKAEAKASVTAEDKSGKRTPTAYTEAALQSEEATLELKAQLQA